MLKYLLIPAISLLGACSSTPPVQIGSINDQYCYTSSETEVVDDQEVSSKTKVSCSDDPLKRAKLAGVDERNCRPWSRTDQVHKTLKTYGGYICRDAKGNWRPLSSY